MTLEDIGILYIGMLVVHSILLDHVHVDGI